MITEAILACLMIIPQMFLGLAAPLMGLTFPPEAMSTILYMCGWAGTIFPVAGMLDILLVSFGIKSFQILWAILIRTKSFIPTFGA